MNKAIITILFLLVAAFIGGFLFFYDPKPVSNPTQNDSPTAETQQKWESKIDDQANVTVTVIPTALSTDSKEWKFDVVLNTHSVELDQDMAEVTTLIDAGGKEYEPLRWEGTEEGGHHREGVLIFGPILPLPQSFELKITGIGGVDRNFTWRFR